ncbi:putative hydrolase, alpha/beta hydrolase fold protein [Mycobacterium kubicae]|uniref:Alpha/beta hydrolase n=1 Tax=Mycobacterium kubicae TaxID=120959 RepID=A0AAX1J9N3_9MYCO|nr:alpha/beta hydrolase [Mycobacterium kubicae]MCV7095364.1 alpha/beta hydrolase [Mycobacterium kubicae]ORW05833.1 hypothetical protein AWC13_24650 [Mycobacterium kubicae]QNI09980.1 alpha/beta hydrolase [Mycobacterium kubicae]QPI38181.1 alpha/beta hydrolase [Mycobacterium kubicae]GFG62540.1 putative hydrolase, alpha/beta hydrolase fold protein [Mycobacterium kubicae]
MDVNTLDLHRQFATISSGPVSYLDVGRGRTAVFIHGVVTNSLLWRNVISAVASADRRCIAMDLPGHGHTPAATIEADVSLTALANRVIELCDHLKLDQIDLIGNDTGGAVAQIAATRLRNRLATLTLTNCDTEGNVPPPLFKPVVFTARWPRIFARVGPWAAAHPRLMRVLLAAGYQDIQRVPAQILTAYWQPVLGTGDRARSFAHLLASIDSDDLAAVTPQLRQLHVPTLIAWGTGDPFFRLKWAHRLAELIPGTTKVATIRGGRLFFPDERAAEFVELLQEHWGLGIRPPYQST